MTTSGKLDRRGFAESHAHVQPAAVDNAAAAGAAPRSATEIALASITAEVLGHTHFTVDDNFFEIGGHSLLATRIVSRIRALHATDFSLRELYLSPTVAALAALLDGRQQAQDPAATRAPAALVPVPRGAVLPLSFGQERLWPRISSIPAVRPTTSPRPCACPGRSGAALCAALDCLVARHEPLRSCFPAVAGRASSRSGRHCRCNCSNWICRQPMRPVCRPSSRATRARPLCWRRCCGQCWCVVRPMNTC